MAPLHREAATPLGTLSPFVCAGPINLRCEPRTTWAWSHEEAVQRTQWKAQREQQLRCGSGVPAACEHAWHGLRTPLHVIRQRERGRRPGVSDLHGHASACWVFGILPLCDKPNELG